MDMIIKAAVLAAEGVDHMAREGLDHTQTQIEALSRAVGVANELGCEDEDVSSAFARLIKTQELVETRRAQLHKNALSSIADQADNGLDTTGMAPCTTAAQLKSDIAAAVDALVARVREGGMKLRAVFGHAEPVSIDPEVLFSHHPLNLRRRLLRWSAQKRMAQLFLYARNSIRSLYWR